MAGDTERKVHEAYIGGLAQQERDICAEGDGTLIERNQRQLETNERLGLDGVPWDIGPYCRLTMERVIQETFNPTPIPEGNTLIKQPHILDFYDHLNENHFGGVAPDPETGFRNLQSFLQPQMYVPYGISVQKPNGENYIFDTAEAADMGATMVTLNILRHMQDNNLDTVPPIEALAGIDRAAAEDTYERCIESANEIALSQSIPADHDLSMEACYTAGTQLAAFVANDVSERQKADASGAIPRPQVAVSR